ncbi:MAG: tRNA 2-thiouridine(34) synthase MnmA [Myxococcota bacterium]
MRIVVAMSGGVDSSTVAGLLVEAGHEVIGLAMKTHAEAPKHNRACCTPDDMRDARRVADHLGIPFYVLNYAELFREVVIGPFAEAYTRGRTPNPCIECNDKVKFRPLLARAKLLGAEKLATGHYARIEDDTFALRRGVDPKKDQSYFLYRLDREQLGQLLFPVGGMHKDEVRAHAARLGLPVAEKRESQEICFVGDGGYAATVETIAGRGGAAGQIVDGNGKSLGVHEGVHHFTYGQRRGLRIAASEPLYVTDIDAASGTVRVGPREQLETDSVVVEGVRWTQTPPHASEVVLVQQRYRESPKACRVEQLDAGTARLWFVDKQPRGAPGQAAVIYRDDVVLGGGSIAAAARPSAEPDRARAAP